MPVAALVVGDALADEAVALAAALNKARPVAHLMNMTLLFLSKLKKMVLKFGNNFCKSILNAATKFPHSCMKERKRMFFFSH